MSNPAKRRGTAFESAVVAYLRERGVRAYRPAQAGFRDEGDVHGVSPFILQCKAYRDITAAVREGVEGAVVQAGHAGEPFGAAVVKRARKPISDSYVVLRLEDLAALILQLRND